MKNKIMTGLLCLALSLSTFTVQAGSVTSADFEIIVVGDDQIPPHTHDLSSMFMNYEVWVVNNSNQTIVFDDNLFLGDPSLGVELNGESIFQSDALNLYFSAIDDDYDDGGDGAGRNLLPGRNVFFA